MALLVRRNDRREVRRSLSLRCQMIRAKDFDFVGERVLDLSPDGMLVETSADLEPGETVHVSFQATDLNLWFHTDAKVARRVRGRRDEDRGVRAVGLSFAGLSRLRRLILRGHLRRVPPPLPKRAQRIDWAATVRSVES